jgi:hypothetical protein
MVAPRAAVRNAVLAARLVSNGPVAARLPQRPSGHAAKAQRTGRQRTGPPRHLAMWPACAGSLVSLGPAGRAQSSWPERYLAAAGDGWMIFRVAVFFASTLPFFSIFTVTRSFVAVHESGTV